jgi:TPR repeat protein
MYEITSDQELDQLVWSYIKDSSNPQDYLDYLRHTLNRESNQEEAYVAAEKFWSDKSAPRHFLNAVAALEELAERGNKFAMFHLGRWYRLGYGVPIDAEKGMDWYRRGATAGSSKCLINVARYTALDDPKTAIEMYQRAVTEFGDMSAHCFWADVDKPNQLQHLQHLRLGASTGDSYAMYCLAFEQLKHVNGAEEAQVWVDFLKRAGEKGESYACAQVGQIYLNGYHGISKDVETGRYWLKKSVALGNEGACAILGRDLLGEDDAAAIGYLKRAAMLEDAFGQSVLGLHLTWSGKTHEEQLEGVAWLRASALQGHRPAMNKLAEALRHDRGPEVEVGEALKWLKKGAGLGVIDCQTSLGIAYIQGETIARDEEKAHNLFHLASLQGDPFGTYLLGLTYENGHGTSKDLEQAFGCYKTAAGKGEIKAAYKVGVAYLWGEGVEEDVPAAAKWLKKAANAGHADSQAYLGMLFAYGHGVEENAEIALFWLQQSAKQNCPVGLRELANMYEAGDGVEADLTEATRLMAKAASLGDTKAQAWIDKHCPEKPAWLKELGDLADKPLPDIGNEQGDEQ